MEDRNYKIEHVPYIVHESITCRLDHTIKKLWILCIILVSLLVVSNTIWIVYECQFQEIVTTQEVTQDSDGGNNIVVGGDYGKADY